MENKNRINVRFPDESIMEIALPRTTAFHSEDGRPLYKDSEGKVHDPISVIRDMVKNLDAYSKTEINELIDGVKITDYYTKSQLDNVVGTIDSKILELKAVTAINKKFAEELNKKIGLVELTSFLDRTGVGYYTMFELSDLQGINLNDTTATIDDGKIVFKEESTLVLEDINFGNFTEIELAVYESNREDVTLEVDTVNSDILEIETTPSYISKGQSVFVDGEVLDVMDITPISADVTLL